MSWAPWFDATVRAQLSGVPAAEPLDPDRQLVAYGLDSFGWMAIATDLRPWVSLPDELLLPSTFRTMATLWAAVQEAMADSGPATIADETAS